MKEFIPSYPNRDIERQAVKNYFTQAIPPKQLKENLLGRYKKDYSDDEPILDTEKIPKPQNTIEVTKDMRQ